MEPTRDVMEATPIAEFLTVVGNISALYSSKMLKEVEMPSRPAIDSTMREMSDTAVDNVEM